MNKCSMIFIILILSLIIFMLIISNIHLSKDKKEFYYQKLDWFLNYTSQLKEIISKLPLDVIITGSGALALLLFKLEMFDELNEMLPPNDLDLIYIGKGSDFFTKDKVGDFQRIQRSPGRSVSFVLKGDTEKDVIIKSFDLTMLPSIDSVDIDGFKVITPQKLLYFYQDEDDPKLISKNESKITKLNMIIQKINDSPNLKYVFFSNRERKRMRDMNENDDENAPSFLKKRINFMNIN